MSKTAIYEFNPIIYPTRLWVCKKPNTKDVSDLFYPFDNNGEQVDGFGEVLEYDLGKYANTVIVGNKESCMRGCLVSIFRPSECGAGICSHEALHYIAYLSSQFDIPLGDFNTSEPLAYLEQWATNCINMVLIGHPERMNGKLLEYK
jgi:hypothetical protein